MFIIFFILDKKVIIIVRVTGRVSKFRHLKGTPGHKSTHIENIRNISRQISGECDGFHGKVTEINSITHPQREVFEVLHSDC